MEGTESSWIDRSIELIGGEKKLAEKECKRAEEGALLSHQCHAAASWLQLQQCSLPAPLLWAALLRRWFASATCRLTAAPPPRPIPSQVGGAVQLVA